jgi:hypothetical protein
MELGRILSSQKTNILFKMLKAISCPIVICSNEFNDSDFSTYASC